MKATKIIAVLAVALMAAGTVGLTSCKGKDKGKTASTKDAKGNKKGKAKKVELPEDAFDVEFTEDESGCIIQSKRDVKEIAAGNDVTYPSTVQGLPVKGIKLVVCDYEASSLTIPEGVVWVNGCGLNADWDSSLAKVTLPSTLKVIGEDTFAYCKNLSECNLPEGLEVIFGKAFFHSGLKSVTLPKSLKYYIYNNDQPFAWCDSLEEINIPEGLVITVLGGENIDDFFSGDKIKGSLALQKTIKDKLKLEYINSSMRGEQKKDDIRAYLKKTYKPYYPRYDLEFTFR
ncbi:MAG: leucine-rich repeat domain-containing protein [Treponema sp.]|nr:leucine-rich repeat domain-containing protein [Treponema sp.]